MPSTRHFNHCGGQSCLSPLFPSRRQGLADRGDHGTFNLIFPANSLKKHNTLVSAPEIARSRVDNMVMNLSYTFLSVFSRGQIVFLPFPYIANEPN